MRIALYFNQISGICSRKTNCQQTLMPQLAIKTADPQLVDAAKALATELSLPYSEAGDFEYWLELSQEHLALVKANDYHLKPLYIDFESGKSAYRQQHTSLRKEPLARAMGMHPDKMPFIVDATAGFGQDGYMLASLGYHVLLLERSPILFALLRDGLRRIQSKVKDRIQLHHIDARDWYQQTTSKPDIIYLDPMFPERKKSAAVKKNMAILHDLIDCTEDVSLLDMALACATQRVVVKRPRNSKNLGAKSPTYSISGPNIRYDIYQVG